MFRRYHLLLFLVFISAFEGCKNSDDFFKSAGNPQTIQRPLIDFNAIEIGEKFLVNITQDTSVPQNVSIEYFENLNAKIITEINNNTLKISDGNSYNWTRDLTVRPKVTINIHTVTNLSIQGACELICLDTIYTGNLNIDMHSVKPAIIKVNCGNLYGGSSNLGPISFEGRGTIFSWSCEQGSWFDAKKLYCDDAYIRHYTKQDCYVYPEKQFEANIYNSGNLFYKSRTFYKSQINTYGSGKAIPE